MWRRPVGSQASLGRVVSSEEEVVVGVEQWAEFRRLYFVKRLSIKEIVRRTGHGRNTIRRALRSAEAPRYRRPPRPSKLDPFPDAIHPLLRAPPRPRSEKHTPEIQSQSKILC